MKKHKNLMNGKQTRACMCLKMKSYGDLAHGGSTTSSTRSVRFCSRPRSNSATVTDGNRCSSSHFMALYQDNLDKPVPDTFRLSALSFVQDMVVNPE